MQIDWAALGQVFGVSLVVTVGLVGVFTLGIVGTSRRSAEGAGGDVAAAAPTAAARTGAYACFALCAAAVGYGIYLIVA
ncbi:membrane protein [Streptomyces eurocidicus]|uniref:Membrane protein n=1 Tax=Streptomyces eurocidicus TaxID=66423 RepID=A0A2N8NM89_STREU|nr:hypothetical protein [Streptomyces eurocidicus]MBB5118368.1 hypothetical protein [Streptomyces eurocidicus]MBF6051190.1 hypothetical protein [Streptomyces eurocidicus]PNE29886.1 membrane protein [Streptomyces eurocidicus]